MKSPSLSRRDFLKTSAAATAALATTSLLADGKYGGNKIPFGLQLYSVRDDCAKDLDGTVTKVGKMGYKGVEFAGYYGRDAKSLRRLLDDCGLKCCGTHTGLDTLQGDKLPRTIEFNQILGNKYLIVPSLPGKYTKTRQGWLDAADVFNGIAEQVKPQGMVVGYHNHNVEFTAIEGEIPWDTFFNRAKDEVVVQFDMGNGVAEGGDPVMYLKRKPGRVASVHVKPFSRAKPNALIGDDEQNWPEIFRLCETIAGVKWYIIEYESDAFPPLVSVEKTLDVMRRWGKC